ncbi:MAG: hypothetical protein PHT39_01855 [Sphaerochaetaceae bacterium]|nr:hypothetical protein [Sphaerochaetaceae bacterium]
MKKNWLAVIMCIVSVLAVLAFAGCATKAEDEKPAASSVLGKDGIPRPDWVISDASTAEVHYAAGYGKMSNLQNSIKRAEAEGRNLLAEWVSLAVDEIITSYTNDAGEGANRQAMDAFEVVGKQRAQAILSGCTRADMWEDAEGGVWVLMSIPVANVADQMENAAAEATGAKSDPDYAKNEAAQEANTMMNDAIAKYFGSPSVTD